MIKMNRPLLDLSASPQVKILSPGDKLSYTSRIPNRDASWSKFLIFNVCSQ